MLDRWRKLAVGAGLALVLGSTTLVSPASGAHLACGDTVTTHTTLHGDIGPCSDHGLIVGADNIVINLNGYRIFGTPEVDDGAGVYVLNRTGVTVRGGTVTDFDAGVVIQGGSRNTVQQMVVRDNIGDISPVAFTDFGDGILVFNSSHNRVLSNLAENNGPYSGITLLGNADDNLIQGNTTQKNVAVTSRSGHGGSETQENDGIRVETISNALSPDRNRIVGNTVKDNGLDGIAVFPLAKDNIIEGNVVTGNGKLGNVRPGDGIHVFGRSQRTIVRNNRVTANARHGIILDFFDPDSFTLPSLNRVERNISVGNGVAPDGFPAFDLNENNRFCADHTWANNVFQTKNDPGADCIH